MCKQYKMKTYFISLHPYNIVAGSPENLVQGKLCNFGLIMKKPTLMQNTRIDFFNIEPMPSV